MALARPPPSEPGAGVEARQVTEALLVEQPYHWTRAETRDLIYGVVAPNSGHVTYKVVTDGSYADTTPYPFAAVAVLNTALAQWTGASEVDLTLTVANLPSTLASPNAAQYDAGQALLQIDGELLAYRTLTRNPDGTVTFCVNRTCTQAAVRDGSGAAGLPGLVEKPALEPRGALWVGIDAGDTELQLINTHLGLYKKERQAQVMSLLGEVGAPGDCDHVGPDPVLDRLRADLSRASDRTTAERATALPLAPWSRRRRSGCRCD
mgnify:CR=1 FL=1